MNKEDLFRPTSNEKQSTPFSNYNQDPNFRKEEDNPRIRRGNTEADPNAMRQNKNLNFNPSFEPTYNDQPNLPVVEQAFEDKKRRNDYGEFLKQQMKQKEIQKQTEKNENRYPDYQQTMHINNEKDIEKKRKNEYADFLRQQVSVYQRNVIC
jgi:hypothetical protein